MKQKIKMMALVRKDYEVDLHDKDAMKIVEADFDKQTVGDTAFHHFPAEEEVEL